MGRSSEFLRAGRSGDLIPVEARFYAPVQIGHGTYLDGRVKWVPSLFPGRKAAGAAFSIQFPSVEVKARVELLLYSPTVPELTCSRVT